MQKIDISVITTLESPTKNLQTETYIVLLFEEACSQIPLDSKSEKPARLNPKIKYINGRIWINAFLNIAKLKVRIIRDIKLQSPHIL